MAEEWGEHNYIAIVSIIIEHLLYTSYYSRYLAHHSIIPVIFIDEKNQRSKIFSNLFNISQLIKVRFIKSHHKITSNSHQLYSTLKYVVSGQTYSHYLDNLPKSGDLVLNIQRL